MMNDAFILAVELLNHSYFPFIVVVEFFQFISILCCKSLVSMLRGISCRALFDFYRSVVIWVQLILIVVLQLNAFAPSVDPVTF